MKIASTSFENAGLIPALHTCEGNDQSPQISFSNLPDKTKSLALIMVDPDAPSGDFVHWVAWNIDPKASELKANIDANAPETLLVQGKNSAGKIGYMGPCPPSGTHSYIFKLYALDSLLSLPNTTTKKELLAAIDKHILGQAELIGKYQKTR